MAMTTVERKARAMNSIMRRIYLLEHGWEHDGPSWFQPGDGRVYTVPQAIRVQLAEEEKQ